MSLNKKADDALYVAVAKNDLILLKELEKNGADIHQDNDKAFLIACMTGNLEVLDYLLSRGLNVNTTSPATWGATNYHVYGNGLSLAVTNEKWSVYDYLLEKGINLNLNDSLALQNLIVKGDLDRIKYLVSKGADVNASDALINALMENQWEIAHYLIDETNIDIHANEDFALRNSCVKNKFDIVKKLVEKGADVNAIPVIRRTVKMYGINETALTCAIAGDNWEIFNYLLENGANPSINNQEPFLHYCKLMRFAPKSTVFLDYYINNKHVVFNDDVFEVVVKLKAVELLKFFLTEYDKVDIDKSELLQNKAIYQRNQTGAFDYLLNEGYQLSQATRDMLTEDGDKSEFLKILMKYDLGKELPKQNNSNRIIKV